MREAPDKAFLIKFGTRLNELRTLNNLSYRKMAQKCKIDHSDIAKYELGETNITLLTLNELAKGLDVDPNELLKF